MSDPKKMYDPVIYQEAVKEYTLNQDKPAFQQALDSFATQAYAQAHHSTRQEEANKKAFEKKNHENQLFFSALLAKEIEERVLIHDMIDFQNTLKEKIIEEIERIEKAEIENKKFVEGLNLNPEQKAAIERQALENSLSTIEEKIHFIDNKINQIEANWGGKTWEEGQKKNSSILSQNFAQDIVANIDFGAMSVAEKDIIMNAINDCRNNLQERLEKRIDPDKLQKIVANSYSSATAAAPPAPNPSVAPSKSQVVVQTKVLTSLDHFFAARELQKAFKEILPEHDICRWNIAKLAKYAESNNGFKEYLQKIDDFSKHSGLKAFKNEMRTMAETLKSQIESNKIEEPGEASSPRPK